MKDLYYNNSKEEYKLINPDFKVTDDYIDKLKEETDKKLEVSNSIIVYDLLKNKTLGE